MNCPVCKHSVLSIQELQPGVMAQKCAACAGLWLNSLQFSNWISSATTEAAAAPLEIPPPPAVTEPKAAKLCPECGHFMARYKVGPEFCFTLERCGHCGGSWFDGNEWETLKSSALWNQIHLIFSPAWQARVRRAEQSEQRLAQLAARLGPVDFAETQRMKKWVDHHAQREVILAHLMAEPED